ncbi:hypothetical protein ASF87_16765 [Microbacterium sp. Leaf161]|uniref:hypothetical protein n=1 Tax=Microbacterium sp. Leaf161 TaxID=1736281 RepID=UPI0006FF2CFA|nr:hypothetical protein [Microbacterium sp. Leaf161]KQR43442.1 hypothetical protein ASF87_16765 [Microbacterium sp. Leaf161]
MTPQTRADRRAALVAAGAIADDDGLHTTDLTADDYRPTVPVTVRDAVYWTTLGTAAASALASGVAGIWFPDIAGQVLATGGVATTVMGIIGGGVGVVYRPGASL